MVKGKIGLRIRLHFRTNVIVFLISLLSNKYINRDVASFLGMVGRGWGIGWGRSMIGGRGRSIGWSRSVIWCRGRCIGWSRGMVGGRGRCMVTILVVLDQRLVRTGDSLILDISMVLLVLIHIVVNNLGSAIRELHSVLA